MMKHPRKLVFVCTGSDCKKAGCKQLSKDLKSELNTAPFKGKFKLIKTKCLDMCKSAPVTIIEDHFFKKATVEKMQHYLKKP